MTERRNSTNRDAQKRLAVLTKSLDSPDIKTRLGEEIGVKQARFCYAELLTATLHSARAFDTTVYVEGEVRDSSWLQSLPAQSQGNGDLGERMLACFEDGVAVLIGGDCPLMSQKYIQQAFEVLENCDLVLGPSEDGGYVLIGMNEPHPHLFSDITWGTRNVLRETVTQAESLDLKVDCLDQVWDVDHEKDYHRWLRWRKSEGNK